MWTLLIAGEQVFSPNALPPNKKETHVWAEAAAAAHSGSNVSLSSKHTHLPCYTNQFSGVTGLQVSSLCLLQCLVHRGNEGVGIFVAYDPTDLFGLAVVEDDRWVPIDFVFLDEL